MIIVKKDIFKRALALMSPEQLAALVRETLPPAPIEKGIAAFGKWLEVIYHCFREQLELKKQSDLANLIGLSQSDISTLFNRPHKISLSRDRMKEIEEEIQNRISELPATG